MNKDTETKTIPPVGYNEIEDRSHLPPILTPSLRDRETAKIKLSSNGLQAYVISDPSVAQSGAALVMETGSFLDPTEHRGMAHLTEHLLFMGCRSYPEEDTFEKQITHAGGRENARTKNDHTDFFFLGNHANFLETLSYFAALFIEPLFTPKSIESARAAVDEEYASKRQTESVRFRSICEETQNPAYPLRFGWGNLETLGSASSRNVRSWYEKHYSADKAHLFIHSVLPLGKLIPKLVSLFSAIPCRETPQLKNIETITVPEQQGTITYITSFTDYRELVVRWEAPIAFFLDLSDHSAQPFQILFGAEHKGSLYDELHNQQNLVNNLSIHTEHHAYGRGFFDISCMLVKEGVVRYREILDLVFQTVNRLIREGKEESQYIHQLFAERQMMQKINYQYQDRQVISLGYLQSRAEDLCFEPLETFPSKTDFLFAHSPQKFSVFTQQLKPKQAMYYLLAPMEELTTVLPGSAIFKQEKWTDAPYYVQRLDEKYLNDLENVEANYTAWPPPNPYIPYQLIKTASDHTMLDVIPSQETPLPEKIIERKDGTVYHWKDNRYYTKNVYFDISFRFPYLVPSPKLSNLMFFFLSCFYDHLREKLYFAGLAGFSVAFSSTIDPEFGPVCFTINITGYRELRILYLLIEDILQGFKHCYLTEKDLKRNSAYTEEKLKTLFFLTEKKFELWHKQLISNLKTQSKQFPDEQAKEILNCTLSKNKYRVKDIQAAMHGISYDAFQSFAKNLLEQVTYAEVMLAGDLTKEEAVSFGKKILGYTQPYFPTLNRKDQALSSISFSSSRDETVLLHGSFEQFEKSNASGHALLLMIREAPLFEHVQQSMPATATNQIASKANKAMMQSYKRSPLSEGYGISARILGRSLRNDVFNQLRTQQQLAYQVNASFYTYRRYIYQYFMILSNRYLPDELQNRLEVLLKTWHSDLGSKITEDEFSALKIAEIEEIKRPHSTLNDMGYVLNNLAFQREGRDFDIKEKLEKTASKLGYKEFKQHCRFFLSPDRLRFIIKVQGKNNRELPTQELLANQQKTVHASSLRPNSTFSP